MQVFAVSYHKASTQLRILKHGSNHGLLGKGKRVDSGTKSLIDRYNSPKWLWELE